MSCGSEMWELYRARLCLWISILTWDHGPCSGGGPERASAGAAHRRDAGRRGRRLGTLRRPLHGRRRQGADALTSADCVAHALRMSVAQTTKTCAAWMAALKVHTSVDLGSVKSVRRSIPLGKAKPGWPKTRFEGVKHQAIRGTHRTLWNLPGWRSRARPGQGPWVLAAAGRQGWRRPRGPRRQGRPWRWPLHRQLWCAPGSFQMACNACLLVRMYCCQTHVRSDDCIALQAMSAAISGCQTLTEARQP